MGLVSPLKETARGLRTYLRGVRWLKAHPRYLALLSVPWGVGLVFFIAGVSLFVTYDETVVGWLLFERVEADPWWWHALYHLTKVILYVAVVVFTLLSSLLLMNVVASPIYELISLAIEREVTGREPEGLGWGGSLRVMVVEAKKVLCILALSIILLLIPGFNVMSTVISAFLIGWDFFDYPLARRGWSFKQRLRLATGEFWSVLGFGLWLVIPFAQIIMLPLAVAGGTLLNLEALERERLLTTSSGRREEA